MLMVTNQTQITHTYNGNMIKANMWISGKIFVR